MMFMAVSPMLVLQQLEKDFRGEVVGLSALIHRSKGVILAPTISEKQVDSEEEAHVRSDHKERKDHSPNLQAKKKKVKQDEKSREKKPVDKKTKRINDTKATAKEQKQQHNPTSEELLLARGVSGLPFDQTPALVGAKRGHIQCDVDVDDLAYWNSPQGLRDEEFETFYKNPPNRYLTFSPDPGGWNNIRMAMELTFVLAAATGRTLVLPPDAPMYLLGDGTANARSFAHFFPIEDAAFKKRVNVMTMKDFIVKEGKRLLGLNESQIEFLKPIAEVCLHQTKADKRSCDWLFPVLQEYGYQPQIEASHDCLVFDNDYFETGKNLTAETQARVDRFCGVSSRVV